MAEHLLIFKKEQNIYTSYLKTKLDILNMDTQTQCVFMCMYSYLYPLEGIIRNFEGYSF